MILEELELPDLVNMAQVNEGFNHLSRFVFKQKYAHHVLVDDIENVPGEFGENLLNRFGIFALGMRLPRKATSWSSENGVFKLHDYWLILNTLKYFGNLIQKFEIQSSMPNKRDKVRRVIYDHLTKYCASTLVQLDLGTVRDIWFDTLKGPFTRLEELIFDKAYIFYIGITAKTLLVAQKFPNLRRLTMKNGFSSTTPLILDGFVPHLEYLNIERNVNSIENFIRQNPHIRSLELTGFPSDYINIVHEHLPNLESLTIHTDQSEDSIEINRPIDFEHLKVLHSHCYYINSLTNISFSNLEELLMFYKHQEVNQWIQFFGMNQTTFTRFILYDYNHVDFYFAFDIQRLVDALPQSVDEISIYKMHFLNAETIVRIIESRANLRKILFSQTEFFDFEPVLRRRFDENWEITATEDNSWNNILFIRKD